MVCVRRLAYYCQFSFLGYNHEFSACSEFVRGLGYASATGVATSRKMIRRGVHLNSKDPQGMILTCCCCCCCRSCPTSTSTYFFPLLYDDYYYLQARFPTRSEIRTFADQYYYKGDDDDHYYYYCYFYYYYYCCSGWCLCYRNGYDNLNQAVACSSEIPGTSPQRNKILRASDFDIFGISGSAVSALGFRS